MSSARNHLPHYKVEDYLQWKGDWELLEGIPFAMTPRPFGTHQHIAFLIMRLLASGIEDANCDAVVLHETDWIVSDDTVVRPDIAVVCGPVPQSHIMQAPALVVEVLSMSTRERDLNFKHDLYLRHNVLYYLTVDLHPQELRMSRASSLEVLPEDEALLTLHICEDCSFELDLQKIRSLLRQI